ncbi:hypothetical protein BD847_1644 [Flavobacterium cutihirudinis]|uniref:Peptidase M23 n=2 Tax=Flavobacterium cutihirudinis TaxID=1265740 RepID=A0A3D9FVX7_9FLAO|nr:hypothetical protein BD847_1644 [Flavobacterium cutihirudinis]
MKKFKLITLAILLMNSTYFFAQQTITDRKIQEAEQRKIENDLRNSLAQNHKELDTKITELKSKLKEAESQKKNLAQSEDNLKSTINKIEKLQTTNQKLENKITTTSISEEETLKLRIKTKENEVSIQKLKLTQITQQKELEKVLATL